MYSFTYLMSQIFKICREIMERVKHKEREDTSIDGDIPTAPTIDDFCYDPGIREMLARSSATDGPVKPEQEIIESLDKMDLTGIYMDVCYYSKYKDLNPCAYRILCTSS